MSHQSNDTTDRWVSEWIANVASGSATMSQRKLSSILAHGGIEAACAAAKPAAVHLALVTDDRGDELVIASVHPIRVLC